MREFFDGTYGGFFAAEARKAGDYQRAIAIYKLLIAFGSPANREDHLRDIKDIQKLEAASRATPLADTKSSDKKTKGFLFLGLPLALTGPLLTFFGWLLIPSHPALGAPMIALGIAFVIVSMIEATITANLTRRGAAENRVVLTAA